MGYKQIDGNKLLLVNEKGQFRYELRNLTSDNDRFQYHYDKNNKIQNRWPKVVVGSSEEDGQDVRLMPEIVLKEHGSLPKGLECSEDDFEAIDGNYLNAAKDNIEYVGDGSFKASKPFKDAPEEKEEPKETSAKTPGTSEPEAKPKNPTPPPPPPPEQVEPEDEDEMETSKDMTATEAVKIIESSDFGELEDLGFYTEEERDRVRVTVKDAWEKAEKEYKDSLTG